MGLTGVAAEILDYSILKEALSPSLRSCAYRERDGPRDGSSKHK